MLSILFLPFTIAFSLIQLAVSLIAGVFKLVTFSIANMVTIAGLLAIGFVVIYFFG